MPLRFRRAALGSFAATLLTIAGCESSPHAAPATLPRPDPVCPHCQIKHYAWQTYRHGTLVDRKADVMTCPYCRSARENLLRGCDPKPSCDACGKNRDCCPMCRGSDD
jgi:hypothetical protein